MYKSTYALVMPYDGHRFQSVEQLRYPVGAWRWEVPQGTASDLTDFERVKRELREETRLHSTLFETFGQLDTALGKTSQRGWVVFDHRDLRESSGARARGTGS